MQPPKPPETSQPTLSNAELLAKIASLEQQLREEKEHKEKLKEESDKKDEAYYKLDELYQYAVNHNRSLRGENEKLKRTIREKNKKIKKLMDKKVTREKAYEIFKDTLTPTFTEAQISALWKKDWKRVNEWSHDDFSIAITLRCISAKAYKFIRKSKMVPLPGRLLSNYGITLNCESDSTPKKLARAVFTYTITPIKGSFKYYVIMFLTFLGPPTQLFDDLQYCKSSIIAIF